MASSIFAYPILILLGLSCVRRKPQLGKIGLKLELGCAKSPLGSFPKSSSLALALGRIRYDSFLLLTAKANLIMLATLNERSIKP